jgi:5-methylcytosine-specific restriction endonuclease McrA
MQPDVDRYDLLPAHVFVAKWFRRTDKCYCQKCRTKRVWWAKYYKHLRSKEWAALRWLVIKARGRKCEDCGSTSGPFNLHHKTYVRLGHERLEDVRLLCRGCHKAKHPKRRRQMHHLVQ